MAVTTGIKHWELGGWSSFRTVSFFLSLDTDAPRKPPTFHTRGRYRPIKKKYIHL